MVLIRASLAFAAATTADVFTHKIYVQGDVPTNHFCTVRWASECPPTLPLTVFAQRNFVADFLKDSERKPAETVNLHF